MPAGGAICWGDSDWVSRPLKLCHVLTRSICHQLLGADAVERDFQQRVAAHRNNAQHHAAPERLVLHHLTLGKLHRWRFFLCLRHHGRIASSRRALPCRARGKRFVVSVDGNPAEAAVVARLIVFWLRLLGPIDALVYNSECIFPVLQVRYISVNDNYDSANSFGSTGGMSVALKNLVNALYCKDASKKVRAAKAVLAKQGKYIAAFAPFGYQKSEDDKHMLVPDPVTAPVVQLIFELAIKGMKYTEIANYLNNNGYDSIFEYYQKIGVKRCYERDIGEHMWSASTVMEILYNEVYIGSVINNKTADNIDTGHQVVQRDKEDWIIVENCHEPLVSVEDFKLAHKMIARREVTKRKPNGKWRKSYIRCGICGKGLYKYGNKSSYRCHNGHVSRIRGEELEATLLDIARNMALAQLQEFELKTDGGNCPDNLEREIESLKKSKAHYAKLKFEIYDDYTKTNITRDQMAKKTAEVKQKIAEIESLITEKQETLDMQKDLFLDAKQEQLTKLSKLDEFDEEVIRYLIDYVLVYDNEHIEIRWNFDDFQAG